MIMLLNLHVQIKSAFNMLLLAKTLNANVENNINFVS